MTVGSLAVCDYIGYRPMTLRLYLTIDLPFQENMYIICLY